MNGDITVKFIISGPSGNTIGLSRGEAEHLLCELKWALKTTGKTKTPSLTAGTAMTGRRIVIPRPATAVKVEA